MESTAAGRVKQHESEVILTETTGKQQSFFFPSVSFQSPPVVPVLKRRKRNPHDKVWIGKFTYQHQKAKYKKYGFKPEG